MAEAPEQSSDTGMETMHAILCKINQKFGKNQLSGHILNFFTNYCHSLGKGAVHLSQTAPSA